MFDEWYGIPVRQSSIADMNGAKIIIGRKYADCKSLKLRTINVSVSRLPAPAKKKRRRLKLLKPKVMIWIMDNG